MHTPDTDRINAVQQSAPLINQLPGEPLPYYLQSGEGEHLDIGPLHVTVMARPSDSGDFTLMRLHAPALPSSPFITLPGHVFIHLFEGELTLYLADGRRRISAGSTATIPAGTAFAIQSHQRVNSGLLYSNEGSLYHLFQEAGTASSSHIFNRAADAAELNVLKEIASSHGIEFPNQEPNPLWRDTMTTIPNGPSPFVLEPGVGENLECYEQTNTYVTRCRNTERSFFAMDTRGAKAGYIPLHFHSLHTENFLCIDGEIRIHANGEEVRLRRGDYLHAPAGTIHAFSFAAHNTHMLGILTTDVFEKFFEYMNVPSEHAVQEEGGEPWFPKEGFGKAQAELDVTVVGPPPR